MSLGAETGGEKKTRCVADSRGRVADCKGFGLRTVQADQTAIFDVILFDRLGIKIHLPALNTKGGEFDFGVIR